MNVSVEKALGFYWDIENCRVPCGKSAFDVVQKLRSIFGSFGSEVEFICVCDVSKESSRIITDLNLAQVHIIHVCSQSKNAADDKLKSLLRRYGATYRPPGTVVLISSDVNFAAELNDLKNRLGFVIILLHNDQVSHGLLAYSSFHYSCSSIFKELPNRVPVKARKRCTSLKVTGIPSHVSWSKIRRRLEKLASNCGGRYIKALQNTGSMRAAVISFATPDSAIRAKRRLQDEDVFGYKISVEFYVDDSSARSTEVDTFDDLQLQFAKPDLIRDAHYLNRTEEESASLIQARLTHQENFITTGLEKQKDISPSSCEEEAESIASSEQSNKGADDFCLPNPSSPCPGNTWDDLLLNTAEGSHNTVESCLAEGGATFGQSGAFSSFHPLSNTQRFIPCTASTFDDAVHYTEREMMKNNETSSSTYDRMSAKLKAILNVSPNRDNSSVHLQSLLPAASGTFVGKSFAPSGVPEAMNWSFLRQDGSSNTGNYHANEYYSGCGTTDVPHWQQPYDGEDVDNDENHENFDEYFPSSQRDLVNFNQSTGSHSHLQRAAIKHGNTANAQQHATDESFHLDLKAGQDPLSNLPPSFGPVDVQVLNLDRNLHIRDVKRLLFFAFAEVTRVIHVTILPHAYGPMVGLVQVPTVRDAVNVVNRVNRHKIGSKRILLVPITPRQRVPSQSVRDSVISILSSVPSKSLLIYRFFDLYETRYGHKITLSDLYEIRDCITLEDTIEGRMVQLKQMRECSPMQRHCSGTPNANNIGGRRSMANTSPLNSGRNKVPSSEVQRALNMSFCSAPSGDISGSLSMKRNNSVLSPVTRVVIGLRQLQTEVHHLLKTRGVMALSAFLATYEAEYGKLPEPKRNELGVPIEHLICSVPSVEVRVSAITGMKIVQWAVTNVSTKKHVAPELNPLIQELSELLFKYPGSVLNLRDLLPAFQVYYHKQLCFESYGFSKLVHMLEALNSVIEVVGSGNDRLITLTHTFQMKRFLTDLQRYFCAHLQQSSRNYEVNVGELIAFWEQYLLHPLVPAEYGVCFVEDLLSVLPANLFRVTGAGDTALITYIRSNSNCEFPLPNYQRRNLDQFGYEAIKMLRACPDRRISMSNFGSTYYRNFDKPLHVSEYGCSRLSELIESFPDIMQIVEGCNDNNERYITLTDAELQRVLVEQVSIMLSEQPSRELKVHDFLPTLSKFTGHQVRPTDYECNDLPEFLAKLSHVIKVEETSQGVVVRLNRSREVHVLTEQILFMFLQRADDVITLDDFNQQYRAIFNSGFGDRAMLKTELSEVVKLIEETTSWGVVTMICLQPIQSFALKVRLLLEQVKPHLIAVNELEDTWFKFYRTPLCCEDYGFSTVMGLVRAASHVLYTKGRGFTVSVCANKNFLSSIGHGHLSESLSPPPRNITQFSPLKAPMCRPVDENWHDFGNGPSTFSTTSYTSSHNTTPWSQGVNSSFQSAEDKFSAAYSHRREAGSEIGKKQITNKSSRCEKYTPPRFRRGGGGSAHETSDKAPVMQQYVQDKTRYTPKTATIELPNSTPSAGQQSRELISRTPKHKTFGFRNTLLQKIEPTTVQPDLNSEPHIVKGNNDEGAAGNSLLSHGYDNSSATVTVFSSIHKSLDVSFNTSFETSSIVGGVRKPRHSRLAAKFPGFNTEE